MKNGHEWLFAPADAGMCKVESLLDGTLDLYHVAEMNEFLAIKNENMARARAAQAARKK